MSILDLGVLEECLPSLERAWQASGLFFVMICHKGWLEDSSLISCLLKGRNIWAKPFGKIMKGYISPEGYIFILRCSINTYKSILTTYLFKSSNTSGSRKLRRDQSSDKLFCSGVPVNSSLLSVLNCFNSRIRRQFIFLILCPSSTIKYFQ